MILARLTELAHRHFLNKSLDKQQLIPGLSMLRRDAPSQIEAVLYEPVMCLILQGSKSTSIGDQRVDLQPGDALLVSHSLPVVSQITQASPQKPYLALILALDLQVLHSLHTQVAEAARSGAGVRSLASGPAEAGWLEPLLRYVELSGSSLDANVLGASTLREIHYRLLLSSTGALLRDLLIADSHASRIATAIHQMRSEYRLPLKVTDIAKIAGMSASSFHEHFKVVTGTTPLQYQKDLRLIQAHTLLAGMSHSVAEAAYAVGYESANHFSRDYRRKFGLPPSRGKGTNSPAIPNVS